MIWIMLRLTARAASGRCASCSAMRLMRLWRRRMSNNDNVTLNDLPTGWIYTTLDIIRVDRKILVGWVEV